jgi:hypothetical protein
MGICLIDSEGWDQEFGTREMRPTVMFLGLDVDGVPEGDLCDWIFAAAMQCAICWFLLVTTKKEVTFLIFLFCPVVASANLTLGSGLWRVIP